MSEEEKKAINQLKADTSFYDYELKNGKYIYELFKIEVYKKDVDVLLNLIDNQQKEISLLKDQLEYVKSEYEETIEQQQKEIERLEARKYIYNAVTGEISQIPLNNNYISKDKIKAKIEELEKEQEDNRKSLYNAVNILNFKEMDKISNRICVNMTVRDILQSL